jgi:hypothetical protein
MRLDKVISEAATHKLIGGQLCLDFANTINGHGRATPHEYLIGYPDLVVWSRRADLLTAPKPNACCALPKDLRKATSIYKRAIDAKRSFAFSRRWRWAVLPGQPMSPH